MYPKSDQQFYQVGDKEIYIYSAFLDNRLPNKTYVRMFGMQPPNVKTQVYCRIRNGSGTQDIPPERIYPIYPWWPSEKLHLHAYYYGCELPRSNRNNFMKDSLLEEITLVTTDSKDETNIPLFAVNGAKTSNSVDSVRPPKYVGICVKAVWGKVNAFKLAEWIELNRLAGVTKFIFYDVATTGSARKVIDYYSRLGIVDIIQYSYAITMAYLTKDDSFDNHLKKSSMAMEQAFLVSINDCLYRYQDQFKYLLVTDLDELLLPTTDENLVQMLTRAAKDNSDAASYTFHTAWHFEEFGEAYYNAPPYLQFQKYARRSEVIKSQPKSIFMADRFVSANWHGVIMMPWGHGPELKGNVYLSPEDYGFVHHYRLCKDKYKEQTCKDMIGTAVLDHVIPRYRSKVEQKVKDILTKLKLV